MTGRRLKYQTIIGSQNGRDAASQAKQLTTTLLSILDQFQDVTPEIALSALEPTFAKSKMYCPKDTGRLVASGYLQVMGGKSRPRVEIGYGKGGIPHYTAIVHEDTGMAHKEPTRAKWLQAAVFEDLSQIEARLGGAYTSFMNGSGGSK